VRIGPSIGVLLLPAFIAFCVSVFGCASPPDDSPPATVDAGEGGETGLPEEVPEYGIWERSLENARDYPNKFKYGIISLDATFTSPSGRRFTHWGFYDGDGRGGQEGNIWKVRFMPDERGTWRYELSFSDGAPISEARGMFECVPSDLPGPARLDPANPRLLADARGNPVHWRGYAIKHRLYHEPLDQASARHYIKNVIEPLLVGGGYNATYFAVPGPDSYDAAGRIGRGTRTLWGDFKAYDLGAAHFTDAILRSLHEHRIWTVGWITFCSQSSWDRLWTHYREWMKYFVARYGAYYNYFHWSPCWEVAELADWIDRTDAMMGYLASIDPWTRLQGVHDRAREEWQDWQSIHARQNPTRTVDGGNNRATGVDPSLVPYGKVVLGAEDLWEMAVGLYGQPRNGSEVRRGLWGELLANVLTVYDENDEFSPPSGGIGRGEGEPYVRIAYDWWFENVSYRDPGWKILDGVLPTDVGQRCSGIPGEEYVVYREGSGPITLALDSVRDTFTVSWLNPVTGETWENVSTVKGGGERTLHPPFSGDDVVLLLGRDAGDESR
jgi:hypothetical protein